jgi:hypothetical protein
MDINNEKMCNIITNNTTSKSNFFVDVIHFKVSIKECKYIQSSVELGIHGVIESCTDILTTSYWLHVELEKKI